MNFEEALERKLLWRTDNCYEQARRDGIWSARVPSRHPAGIVLAENADDVVHAVRLARERGLQVSVRAGGHHPFAPGLRDGALLIDVARLTDISIDAPAMTAVVGPGVRGRDIDRALDPLGLLFPHGHCSDVAVGGFLLYGGQGWGWRHYGPGCLMVRAVDVVTADGELVRADDSQNSDLYWAARGAGRGFFGVVTAFHVELKPRPAAITAAMHIYPLSLWEELLIWQHGIHQDMAPIVDQATYISQIMTGSPDGPAISLGLIAFANSEREASEALDPITNGPLREKATSRAEGIEIESMQILGSLYPENDLYPDAGRYAHYPILSSAPASALVPQLEAAVSSLPTSRSHVSFQNLSGVPELPDMAYSLKPDTMIEVVAVWEDPSKDGEMQAWVTHHAGRLEPMDIGNQVNGDATLARGLGPDVFLNTSALTRLEAIRDRWDPERRFVSFSLLRL